MFVRSRLADLNPNLRTTSAGPKRLPSHTLFHRRPFPSRRSAAVHAGPDNRHSVGIAPRTEAIISIADFEPGQHHRAPGLRSGDVQSSLMCQVALPAFFGWCHWQRGISGWGSEGPQTAEEVCGFGCRLPHESGSARTRVLIAHCATECAGRPTGLSAAGAHRCAPASVIVLPDGSTPGTAASSRFVADVEPTSSRWAMSRATWRDDGVGMDEALPGPDAGAAPMAAFLSGRQDRSAAFQDGKKAPRSGVHRT